MKHHGQETLNKHLQNTSARNLNDQCDTEASKYHTSAFILPTPVLPTSISANFQNIPHSSKNFNYIFDMLQEQKYRTYLTEKFKWTPHTWHKIDWTTLHNYIKKLNTSQRVQFIKLSHKWRPTHYKLYQATNGDTQSPSCPLCGEEKEDDDHPYQCSNPIMRDAQMDEIRKTKLQLQDIGTYPLLTEAITFHLKHWFRQAQKNYTQRLLLHIPLHQSLLQNIKDQSEIGWDNLMRGKIAISWAKTQRLYNPDVKIQTWSNKLITLLINSSNKIWEIRNILTFGDTHRKQKGEQKKLNPVITHYYNNHQRLVHPTHHHLFQTPLTLRITFSPQENKQWINTVKLAIKINKRKNKLFYAKHKKITQYITTKKRKASGQTQAQTQEQNSRTQKLRKTYTQEKISFYCTSRDPSSDAPT